MHSYLRAIGFSEYKTKKSVDDLLKEVILNPDSQIEISVDKEEHIVEIKKEFADGMGLIIHGNVNEEEEIEIEYYFPYIIGDHVQANEEVSIEKHIAKNSFACVCDDLRLGVSLIFYLQNCMDYIDTRLKEKPIKSLVPVTFAALSNNAKILLPINKSETEIKKSKVAVKNRNNLIAAARKGDEDAMESLTIEDLDMYTKISRRILKEDVFSIVDSSFMPYGIECDQYTIVADIVDVSSCKNVKTKEEVYRITVNCNELVFNIGINKKDLLGVPEVGRRFKGSIWMQGRVDF
jgi:hypothetical protein